ncbi:hypothetical protein AnigIFM50267_004740 [Aspergillus niger]|nr:hypothetical protein AnigIFM50267_004740 [Aspergillus niger]
MGLHEAIFNRMPREHWLAGTQAKVCGTWKIHQALGKLKSEFALDFLLLTDASDWASYRRSGISTSTAKSVNSSVKASVPFPRTKSFKSSTLALSSEIDQQQKVPRDRLAQYHILTGIEDTKLQDHRKQDFTVVQVVLASGDEKQLREAVIQVVAKKMSNIVLLPLPKLELKLPLSEYGKGSMLSAELRQYILNLTGVDVLFLTLIESATSVLSVAGTVLEELGKIIGKEGD